MSSLAFAVRGVLVKPTGEFAIGLHDIAYVRPLEKHQLQNRSEQPFGFFCIVDHQRDTPQLISPAIGEPS
jgi:ribulose-bisphosphate carboxylase large chain